ncbi:MAG: hypothetical protein ACI9XO_001604 [Paraglaciecola sp.]|jgi:hypothetical protein
MKTLFSTITLLFLLTPIFTQNDLIVKGKVLDKNALFYLEGVSIFEKNNQQNGTYSNKKGFFEINLSNPNSILVFSYLGYETTQERISPNLKEPKIVLLKPDIYQLPRVEISATLKLEPITEPYESIVDFTFWEDRVLYLKKRGDQGYFLVLVEKNGYEIDEYSLKGQKIRDFEAVKMSCFGSLHLVCLNYGFQVDIVNNAIQLGEKYTRNDYDYFIKPCVAQIDNSVIFKKELSNGLISEFYTADAGEKWNDLFRVAAQEELLRSYKEDRRIIALGQSLGAAQVATVAESRAIRAIQEKSDFLSRILYKGIRIPLFKRNDTLLIFNFYENQLQFFDKFGNQLTARNINFHLNKKWDDRVIFDEKLGKFYAVFNNKNGRFLARIDVETGECAPPIHLESTFIKKMAIHDNVLYLLHVERTEPNWVLHKVQL